MNFLAKNYAINKKKLVYLFPHVRETLQELRKQGYQLCLITNGNSEMQRDKIERFELENLFDDILISGEIGIHKPDRAIYQTALDFYHLSPEQACMVGDHYEWEVEAPKRYGLKAAWLNFDNQPLPENSSYFPDVTLTNISELLEF